MVQSANPSQPEPAPLTGSILIEGWRGVNHSFALVNQHHILGLLDLGGLTLFHRDMPFAFQHWDRRTNKAGFAPEDQARIDGLADPGDAPLDCVYRICSPFRTGPELDRRRTLTFMNTELGLTYVSFAGGAEHSDFFTRDDNLIVTTTAWSRDRIADYGFAADRIRVIPHGVDTAMFRPTVAAERAISRTNLGIRDGETVFLNVGVAVWNKGVDLVLTAFAQLRSRGLPVRLILKDQRDVYGISVEQTIRNVGNDHPALLGSEVLGAISVIPGNLSQDELRLLYGVADCYVSPYRAEGFNLPVLEAIACGKPVIVTKGGATDDFCDADVAWQVAGRPGERTDPSSGCIWRYIEPEIDDLVAAMEAAAVARVVDADRFAAGRARVIRDFQWRRAAQDIAALALGASRPGLAPSGPAPSQHAWIGAERKMLTI